MIVDRYNDRGEESRRASKMTTYPGGASDNHKDVLPPCDNLTDFFRPSHGLDLAPDSRSWGNISELDHLSRTNTLNNVTCLEHAPQFTSATFFKVIFLTVMTVFGLIANAATIYSITRNRRRQHSWSTIYTLILHLAVADLLVTVFCIGGEAMWSYMVAWTLGNATCKLFKFLQVFSLYLSTFILVLIGVDRFFAIRYPMRGLNTADRCSKLVSVLWILSAVLAVPQVRIISLFRK